MTQQFAATVELIRVSLKLFEIENKLVTTFGLKNKRIQMIEHFAVREIKMHWIFGKEELPKLDGHVSHKRYGKDHIEQINSREISQENINRYETDKSISCFQFNPGIVFFILIQRPSAPIYRNTRSVIEAKLQTILLEASSIKEKSFYVGEGFCQYLIKGRVQFSKYKKIEEELISKIYEEQIDTFMGVRTYTHFVFDVLPKKDSIILPEISPWKPIQEYLNEPESDSLEVKATFSVDLKKWIYNPSEKITSSSIIEQMVLKNIVAFLNTPTNGVVLIGALEINKQDDTFQKKIEEQGYQRYGNYYVTGLKLDYKIVESKGGDWDAFQLRLRNLIEQHIEPDPYAFVSICKVSIESEDIGLIHVESPFEKFYYLKEGQQRKFYIRNSNATKELKGVEIDEYQRQ